MTREQFSNFTLEVVEHLRRLEESVDIATFQAHEQWKADKRLELYREFWSYNLGAEQTFKEIRLYGAGVLGLPKEDVDIVIAALRRYQGMEKDEHVDLALVKENEE